MSGYRFTATCPRCGGELIPGESSVLSEDHASTEARCDRCMDLWRIEVIATMIEAWPVDKLDPDARLQRARNATSMACVPSMLL